MVESDDNGFLYSLGLAHIGQVYGIRQIHEYNNNQVIDRSSDKRFLGSGGIRTHALSDRCLKPAP